jgi:hypothetical protein
MKNNIYKITSILMIAGTILGTACKKKKEEVAPETVTTYGQKDQAARPGIATVFVPAAKKDQYNVTIPSMRAMAPTRFDTVFSNRLLALNPAYTTNILNLNATQFAGVLSTDVLNVDLSGVPTTYYNGTQVLTGRNLTDDVIDVSLILIFGGPSGISNPTLTSDHVNANDKTFSTTFPYLASPF